MSNEVANVSQSNMSGNMLANTEAFDHGFRVARLFASSKLVPSHLQGKPSDCFIALHVANRMKEDPLTVMQNLYVVSGKPGWHTTYMIARANNSGFLKGRITWESTGTGDTLSVTAKAVLAESGDTISATADMEMARAEGWVKNPKYKSMPEHMLRFRSATMLIRLYLPEVMLGYQTVEELETMPAEAMRDITPPRETPEAGGSKLDEFAGKDDVVDADTGDSAKSDENVDPVTGEVTSQETGEDLPAQLGDEKVAISQEELQQPVAMYRLYSARGDLQKSYAGADAAGKGLRHLLKDTQGSLRANIFKHNIALIDQLMDAYPDEYGDLRNEQAQA